jgi:hypothetical protein
VPLDVGTRVPEHIWRVTIDTGESAKIASVPAEWRARLGGWTDEGYLVFDLYSGSCGYWSCGNRIVVFDIEAERVVYASAASDFTRYLGFLP